MHEKLHHVLSRLYPLSLTSQGDNTGLLIPHLHTPAPTARKQKYLLTIDLTSQNITELTQNGETIAGVIAYHPPIYHAIKKIERGVVMECIQRNIAVYSPHTAVDAAEGGMNDWLIKAFPSGTVAPILGFTADRLPEGHEKAGVGRIIKLDHSISGPQVIAMVKKHLNLKYLRVAESYDHQMNIQTIAVCPGSGASILKGVDADVYLTGEMSHHDILAAQQNNVTVILTEHTNSERGYLPTMKQKIMDELAKEDLGEDGEIEIVISQVDRDPINVI